MTVLHKRVFINHNWISDITPINLVNSMSISKSNKDLILQIITIHRKLSKAILDIPARNNNIIIMPNIKPVQPIQVIKHKNISKVNLDINNL